MNKNFYSATMLTRYINCKHTITNEFNEKKLNLKSDQLNKRIKNLSKFDGFYKSDE